MWHNKAMEKGKMEAMATKFPEKFAINMLKKHRKFCSRGFTHLDATPIVQIHMRHPVIQPNKTSKQIKRGINYYTYDIL